MSEQTDADDRTDRVHFVEDLEDRQNATPLQVTTMALGEEADVTSFAIGEEFGWLL